MGGGEGGLNQEIAKLMLEHQRSWKFWTAAVILKHKAPLNNPEALSRLHPFWGRPRRVCSGFESCAIDLLGSVFSYEG